MKTRKNAVCVFKLGETSETSTCGWRWWARFNSQLEFNMCTAYSIRCKLRTEHTVLARERGVLVQRIQITLDEYELQIRMGRWILIKFYKCSKGLPGNAILHYFHRQDSKPKRETEKNGKFANFMSNIPFGQDSARKHPINIKFPVPKIIL